MHLQGYELNVILSLNGNYDSETILFLSTLGLVGCFFSIFAGAFVVSANLAEGHMQPVTGMYRDFSSIRVVPVEIWLSNHKLRILVELRWAWLTLALLSLGLVIFTREAGALYYNAYCEAHVLVLRHFGYAVSESSTEIPGPTDRTIDFP